MAVPLPTAAFDLLPKPADGRRWTDYVGSYNFFVELEGLFVAQFKSVSGVQLEVAPIEYTAGTDEVTRKRPGIEKYGNITLKRGVMIYGNTTLGDWFQTVLDGKTERKSGSILLLNDKGNVAGRYDFYEAWPCKWKGWELDGMKQEGAVEEIELCVEKIEVNKLDPRALDEWFLGLLPYARK